MTCPICRRSKPCRTRLSIGKRGPAFAKVLPTTTLPAWAFVATANDNGKRGVQ